MRLIKRIKDAGRMLRRESGHDWMRWDDFVSRVEAKSGVLNRDRVLQICVHCPQKMTDGTSRIFDLCSVVAPDKRSIWSKIFINRRNDLSHGYLMVWDRGGLPSSPDQFSKYEKNHDIAVPDYRQRRAWDSITWGDLKKLVRSHPAYQEHRRILSINIIACKAEEIEIRLCNELCLETDLIITSKAAVANVEESDGVPASVKRLLQKQAAEKPSSEAPEWAKEYLRKQDAK